MLLLFFLFYDLYFAEKINKSVEGKQSQKALKIKTLGAKT